MADDDTVITLEPEGSEQQVTKTNGAANPSDDALADLQNQYDDIQRAKSAAEAEAAAARQREAQAVQEVQRARNEAQSARSEAADQHLTSIETSLSAQQTARDAAKQSYKQAMESGNWDAAAEAQERLATAAANIARLADAKDQIETRRETVQRTATEAADVVRQPADPVDAFLQTRKPATQAWLRDHPEHMRAIGRHMGGVASPQEKKLAQKLIAGDADAQAEGYEVESPEYFSHLEKYIGVNKAEAEPPAKPNGAGNSTQQATQQRTQPRRQSVPAAPVNGGGSPASGGSSEVQVRLTKGQAESAEDGTHVWLKSDLAAGRIKDATMIGRPIGLREMARRVHAMSQERPGIFENGNVEQ